MTAAEEEEEEGRKEVSLQNKFIWSVITVNLIIWSVKVEA
jgi:hypothetical protein